MEDLIFKNSVPLKSGANLMVLAILEDTEKAIGIEWSNDLQKAIDLATDNIKHQMDRVAKSSESIW